MFTTLLNFQKFVPVFTGVSEVFCFATVKLGTNLYNIYTTKDKTWTKDDAINMAENFFREDYLNLTKAKIKKKTPKASLYNT